MCWDHEQGDVRRGMWPLIGRRPSRSPCLEERRALHCRAGKTRPNSPEVRPRAFRAEPGFCSSITSSSTLEGRHAAPLRSSRRHPSRRRARSGARSDQERKWSPLHAQPDMCETRSGRAVVGFVGDDRVGAISVADRGFDKANRGRRRKPIVLSRSCPSSSRRSRRRRG